jgi:hypothetical protein
MMVAPDVTMMPDMPMVMIDLAGPDFRRSVECQGRSCGNAGGARWREADHGEDGCKQGSHDHGG